MAQDLTTNSLSSDKGLTIASTSSVNCFDSSNNYDLSLNSSSFNSNVETETDFVTTESTSTSNQYSSTSGYGSINAAAAVSQAVGQDTFADVADLGGNNWGADFVKAPEAWAQGYTGQGVVVAVLDTGVDRNHNDLQKNIWTNSKEIADNGIDDDSNGYIDDVYGWNFDGDNKDTLDGNGHGTHVSGTIAGENNGVGVTGIAYDSKIMPVKVLNDSGAGSYTAIANGIYYAVNNGANVINLSLGGSSDNFILQLALNYASSQGVIVVMAAGNESDSQPAYPARYAENYGIAVGAVDKDNNMAYFSNKAGSDPITYVTAPGVDIYSTVPNNGYASYSGTSMATPHVTGVVALMLSANKNLTDAQVRQILSETSGNSTQAATLNLDSNFVTDSNQESSSFSIKQYQDGFSQTGEQASLSIPEIGSWTSEIPTLSNRLNSAKDLQEPVFNLQYKMKNNEIYGNSVLRSKVFGDDNTFDTTSYSLSNNDKDKKDKDDNTVDIEKILEELKKAIDKYF
ncbi:MULTISPECIES: S8 family peptidase [Nostocales]|uniref:S8 family serine peptidase n=3 Tax=Nostocales TaxID=1161 RepID=A0A0C1QQW2_9CYAN|nr:S8 family peptidase [Tolypothrix bouteillei]KAF3888586.1 S8 family serine peptidase [Tolypothrix bouteillei VB521301]